ncbi:hypothetical protein B0T16DRAFT_383786 [Cercophora newfieldiana]|uniref:Uncharacterized protein n=1 Tax=Cercophora newfieldiana TaxID=92897 RepID=A0AA39YLG7_9PEZI|nr:hypothetical protein B0T16DRAFT_383786 [Cercophora newfieldiana]
MSGMQSRLSPSQTPLETARSSWASSTRDFWSWWPMKNSLQRNDIYKLLNLLKDSEKKDYLQRHAQAPIGEPQWDAYSYKTSGKSIAAFLYTSAEIGTIDPDKETNDLLKSVARAHFTREQKAGKRKRDESLSAGREGKRRKTFKSAEVVGTSDDESDEPADPVKGKALREQLQNHHNSQMDGRAFVESQRGAGRLGTPPDAPPPVPPKLDASDDSDSNLRRTSLKSAL